MPRPAPISSLQAITTLALCAWLAWAGPVRAVPPATAPATDGAPDSVQEPDSDNDTDAAPKEEPSKPVLPLAAAPNPAIPPAGAPMPVSPMPASPTPAGSAIDAGFDTVQLAVLNKVTARSEKLEVPLGSVARVGTIEIIPHTCWKSQPEDQPENAALLEVSEVKQGDPPRRIFLGWMFSSSPGLSALENPFYDVTVLQCEKKGEDTK